jgi:hypothetical protein
MPWQITVRKRSRSSIDQREVGMTRTDVMASSRPLTAGAAPNRSGSPRVRRGLALALLPVLIALSLALVAPGAAIAAGGESTSGYNQKPKEPTTGTSPSKEEKSAPAKEEEPAKTSATEPTSEAKKATTLPFTGFDLRWSLAIGIVLIGAGFSIVVVQRRARRSE